MTTTIAHRAQFDKDKASLKYFLIGAGMIKALQALAFGERHHVGLRKDGKTVAYHHQVKIALNMLVLKDLKNLERRIIAALLHDVVEDTEVTIEDIAKEFGQETANDVWLLTKKFRGEHKDKTAYINALALSEMAIVKGEDRDYNLTAMTLDCAAGVFTVDKLADYAEEAKTVFLPMLKTASRIYPFEMHAYRSTIERLKTGIKFAEAYVAARRATVAVSEESDSRQEHLMNTIKEGIRQRDEALAKVTELEKQVAAAQKPEDTVKLFMDTLSIMLPVIRSAEDRHKVIGALAAQLGVSSLQLTNFMADTFN